VSASHCHYSAAALITCSWFSLELVRNVNCSGEEVKHASAPKPGFVNAQQSRKCPGNTLSSAHTATGKGTNLFVPIKSTEMTRLQPLRAVAACRLPADPRDVFVDSSSPRVKSRNARARRLLLALW